MVVDVDCSTDPARVLEDAGKLLAAEPVVNNLILSLLHERVASGEAGRYWVVSVGGDAVAVAFRSPPEFPVLVTAIDAAAADALAGAIADTSPDVPGVNGPAAAAARFAGAWTEATGMPARPIMAMRLYEVDSVREARDAVAGCFDRAGTEDHRIVTDWMRAFQTDVGDPVAAADRIVEQGLAEGRIWLWNDGAPASMAMQHAPVEGVVRVSAVYTPPARRGAGYAHACVGALSRQIRASGHRCILYADLANPTSNSIYRRLGYEPVGEAVRFAFG